MLSRAYLEQLDRDIERSRKSYRVSQVVMLTMSLSLIACTVIQKAATECVTDRAADRVVSAALASDRPQDALTDTAKRVGIEVVTCTLWNIVRSLTGNAQAASSVESFQPGEWQARKDYDQPKVDAARQWLKAHNQTTEPKWKTHRP